MKLIVQRAESGSVTVNGEVVSQIGQGVVVLVGIHRDDKEADLDWMANKLLKFFYWDSEDGTQQWKRGIPEINGEILLVSQFTLHARLGNGRRPDFSRSMLNDAAHPLFDKFVEKVRALYVPERVKTGAFGEWMKVNICNDGPVTFTFDSFNKRDKEGVDQD